jgi:ParB/RepB/Spo0J family partition protein
MDNTDLTSFADQEKVEAKYIAIKDILADASFNSRGAIAPIDVVDLVKDIEANGLLQPVLVCLMPPGSEKKYRLLAGFRRTMAHIVMQKTEILACIREHVYSETDARFINLAENLKRKELTLMQEVAALQELQRLGVSEPKAAERLGQTRSWVQIRYMICKLPTEVHKEIDSGYISQVNVRELYTIYNGSGKEALYEAVRHIKDARIKGVKGTISVKPPKEKTGNKRVRNKGELEGLLMHFQSTIGNGLYTRVLAWAIGNIEDSELLDSILEYAEAIGKPYAPPADGIVPSC